MPVRGSRAKAEVESAGDEGVGGGEPVRWRGHSGGPAPAAAEAQRAPEAVALAAAAKVPTKEGCRQEVMRAREVGGKVGSIQPLVRVSRLRGAGLY